MKEFVTVQHILIQKLRRSQYFFSWTAYQIYNFALDSVIRVNILDKVTVICPDFYHTHKDLPRQHADKFKEKANSIIGYPLDAAPAMWEEAARIRGFRLGDAPDLSEWQEAADWVRLNREILANVPIESELRALRDYASLVEQGKKSRHQVILPLILEGEETILYL